MTPTMTPELWRTIAEQATKETDSKKLAVLIEQLCAVLDHRSLKPVGERKLKQAC